MLQSLVLLVMACCSLASTAQINTKEVGLAWNPALPLRPGELCNITLRGYEQFEVVRVFVHDRDNFRDHMLFQVCGPIGYLTIRLPNFLPHTIVRLKAEGSGPTNLTTAEKTAYSEDEYIYGDRLMVGANDDRPAHRRGTRTIEYNRSVYINGLPPTIHERQYITIVWEGFPPDTTICVELRCPLTTDGAFYKPVRERYAQLLLYHRDPQLQRGCYVIAVQCTKEGGYDYDTLVRSADDYVLMVN